MVSRPESTRWLVHAYVECRGRSEAWWLYAKPALALDDRLAAVLAGEEVDAGDLPVNVLGIPRDASPAVADDIGAQPERVTWLTRHDVEQAVSAYERGADQPAPATFCALATMMRALERDYTVRVILWFERVRWPADRPAVVRRPIRPRTHA